MKRFIVACAIVLIGLTACDPLNGGKKVDWFGNPLPTAPTGSCKINRPPGPPVDRPHPPLVSNWGIQIEVNAIRFNALHEQVCRDVPVEFGFHLYGQSDGTPGLYEGVIPMPVEGNGVTPWKTDIFVPLEAKAWNLDLIAKAGPTRKSEPDVTLFCNMYVYQGRDIVASASAKLVRANNTVRCRVAWANGNFIRYSGVK